MSSCSTPTGVTVKQGAKRLSFNFTTVGKRVKKNRCGSQKKRQKRPRHTGVVQNIFSRFGYISCANLSTNVFFVPSFVVGLKPDQQRGYEDVMKLFKVGTQLIFEAREQQEQMGCRWIATKIWLVDEHGEKSCEVETTTAELQTEAEPPASPSISSESSTDSTSAGDEEKFSSEYQLFVSGDYDFIKDLGVQWDWNPLNLCLAEMRKEFD